MKILWLGGIVLPRIAKIEKLPINNMNGWLIKTSENMPEGMELVYVFDSAYKISGHTDYYSYYGIKCDKASSKRFGDEYILPAMDILQKENPDVIHIWGTESSHSLAMVEACERLGIADKVVISIQGLVSEYYYHYTAYLPHKIIVRHKLRDLIKGNLIKGQKTFYNRGILEREAISRVKHVIGRTDWDRGCAWDINPDVQYHFNNETLRDEFYTGQWSYKECEKYSIFCSQGYYPIKGIHLVIEALNRIVKEFPEAHLYIGGKDYLNLPFYKQSSYGSYLVSLIKKYDLEKNVSFTGFLNANQMKERYLKSNVFVSASSIENSPNSLGEAMLLGVPCVSSHVGGVHNMLVHGVEGYTYPADEVYMLAYYVSKIFSDRENVAEIAKKAKIHAMDTHCPEKNLYRLMEIYHEISRKE